MGAQKKPGYPVLPLNLGTLPSGHGHRLLVPAKPMSHYFPSSEGSHPVKSFQAKIAGSALVSMHKTVPRK